MRQIKFLVALILFLEVSCKQNNMTRQTVANDSIVDSTEISNSETDEKYYKLAEKLLNSESIGGVKWNMNYNELISVLGQPDSLSDPQISEDDGENYQVAYYNSKGLNVGLSINSDSTKNISWIDVSDSSDLKTSGQIGIGSTVEQLKTVYKEYLNPDNSYPDYIIAGTEYFGIFFDLKDNKVIRIYFGLMGD
jgi:hypothetical protein